MSGNEAARLVESTEKEFRLKKEEQQKQAVKEIVQHTLEKIDELDKDIKELEDAKRILKLDLEDLKTGKLDLIAERQQKDKKAASISLVVIKEVIRETYPQPIWVRPYEILWNQPNYMYCDNSATVGVITSACSTTSNAPISSTALASNAVFTCSAVRDNATGTYDVHGKIVNFR